MAHIVYIRECPKFVQGEGLLYGTHEIIENNIANMKIPLNKQRKGYDIPTQSEFTLAWYRCKKESIPHLLAKMRHMNLKPQGLNVWKLLLMTFVPDKVFRLFGYQKHVFDIIKKTHEMKTNHWKIGNTHLLMMLGLQLIPWLRPAPVVEQPSKEDCVSKSNWHYTLILGVIEDVDRGFGEEL